MAEKEVRKLAAIMFTDIEGYTAFVQKDEKVALEKVAIHRKFLEQHTAEFNGQVIQFYGDGSLSIYESALDAVHCGIAMQKGYSADHVIPVRIGIHVGDIVFKDDTVFGDGVNIASRLQTSGIPGSVYISDRVQSELANHPEIKTRSIGRKKLKNVTTPIEVFVVTNEGLTVPSLMTQMPDVKKYLKYIPMILIAAIAGWYFTKPIQDQFFGGAFKEASISVPGFANYTGNPSFDHVSEMAAHWITKELSATANANVVSSEAATEMIQLAGIGLGTERGRKKYAALTGAVNIVDGSFFVFGDESDSIEMSGYIRDLQTGLVVKSILGVKCKSSDPMECIKGMTSNIKGYWVSRGESVLRAPNYEAYKAFLAAKKAWRSEDSDYVFKQMQKAIVLDPNFIDSYFLMLNFFYNEGRHEEAYDTIQSMRKRYTELDERQANIFAYHTADVEGRNRETYRLFMKEYQKDQKDLFTNNSAMIMSLDYADKPRAAIQFFNEIPYDSLPLSTCLYCVERLEWALCAALQIDSMSLADELAPKLNNTLVSRRGYAMLIMYWIWKNDTTKINELLTAAERHPNLGRKWQYLPLLASRYYLIRGNEELSVRYAHKAIEAYLPIKGRNLGSSYYRSGQLDKALAIYDEVRKKLPSDTLLGEMGIIYARKGDKENALKMITELEAMHKPYDYGVIEYYQGRIYAHLGDFEQATRFLERSLQKGKKLEYWHSFSHDPDLIVLKDYPAYQELMKQLN